MNIFVSNLNFKVRSEDLKNLFEQYGEVLSTKVITDKFSGKSRGFGFVEMKNDDIFNKLLTMKEIITDDKVKLELTKWRQKVKTKKSHVSEDNIYRIAFNAGRNMGILEGLKIAKYNVTQKIKFEYREMLF